MTDVTRTVEFKVTIVWLDQSGRFPSFNRSGHVCHHCICALLSGESGI